MLKKIKKIGLLNRKVRFLKCSRETIEHEQWGKLAAIIAHAYATVPYYRDLFGRHHLKPEDISSFNDLRKIPLTSKQDLVDLERSRITSDAFPPDALSELRSSGSTGEPFRFLLTRAYNEMVGLDCLRSKFIHGMRPTDRILRLGGDATDTETPGNPLKRLFLRKATISSFAGPEEIFAFYNRYRPNVVRGFISKLYTFALWLEAKGLRLDHAPRFVLCSAETAHEFMRTKVAAAFRARVIDRYATVELGVVADNCDLGQGYHVFEDTVYPEWVPIRGLTHFVGTSLDNYATPFIRYDTNDICEPWPKSRERCGCGLNTIKFKGITGRDNDFVRTPEGGVVSPINLVFLMRKNYQFIRKFRFTQEDRDSICAEIVPGALFDRSLLATMAAELKQLTQGLRPDIRIVDHIAPDKSGKMRIVQSRLKDRRHHAH